MEPNPKVDRYAKAKIEEPELRLPKAMLKANTDPSTGELLYYQIFENDTKRVKHVAEAMSAGAKPERRVYRIRNTELSKAAGDDYADLHQIHKVSKCTIGLVVDSESECHYQSFLDLLGTEEQVKMAEEHILDKILKTYEGPVFPVILMPPTVHKHEIRLNMDQVARFHSKNALAMEIVSGSWLQIIDEAPPGGPMNERILYIYGPKLHVVRAVSLIHSQVFKPGESLEAEKELDMLFRELSFTELVEGMKSRTTEIVDFLAACSSSGSGSGQTEEQKEKNEEEQKENNEEEQKENNEEDVENIEESKEEKQEQDDAKEEAPSA